jgi:cellulose synthase/poly-beta-1,6-N-acetylglucosamine synthase-like glycosyltransferase
VTPPFTHGHLAAALFWICTTLAVYPYAIYPAIVWFVTRLRPRHVRQNGGWSARLCIARPPVTHIVAAHNEEALIEQKIRDILATMQDEPRSELVVVSDYSTDRTFERACAFAGERVTVAVNDQSRGKAGAHNKAVQLARNEILIFSDVETRAPKVTIDALIGALEQPEVGCANAQIVFQSEAKDSVVASADLYWRFECWLRRLETEAGVYATSSGPCMAVRKSLFRPLPPTGDTDFTTPLDVIDQGKRCVHLAEAQAFDVPPRDRRSQFRARVRMVAKNFSGTVSRWGWCNLTRHPIYSWSIYSHKVLRWLTPFFLLGALAADLASTHRGWSHQAAIGVELTFFAAACAGWCAYRFGRNWPVVGPAYALMLANAAFAIGVCKALTGRVPSFYLPTRNLVR